MYPAQKSNRKTNSLKNLQSRHNRSREIGFRTVEISQPSPIADHSSKLHFKVFS